MNCSSEEIERKRLAAIQKRQNNFSHSQSILQSPNVSFYNHSILQSPNVSIVTSQPLSSAIQKKYPRPNPTNNFTHTPQSYHPYAKPTNINYEKKEDPVINKVVSGTVYLISEDRFEVNPSEFCGPLINIFKTISSRCYDAKSKLWNFSVDQYQELMTKVAPWAPHVVLGTLPQYVVKLLEKPCINPDSIDLTPIESTLRHKLMPFQEKGVRFGIAKLGRCMIADDMGLGKTFQALGIASYYRQDWPMLIVTTSSMRETWQSKIRELLPSVPMLSVVTLSGARDAHSAADRHTAIVIVSYKVTTMHTQLLKDKKFGVVVIDESHYLKSPKAQCTVALASVANKASRVILLSGTPALSRPAELYSQLNIIEPKFFGGYTEYGKRYCAGKMTSFGWDMTGRSHLAELQVLLQRRFLIRRTKEQVLIKLQDKTRESVMLNESLLQFSAEEQSGLTQMAQRYSSTRASERQAALLSFFSETAKVKIPAICKYLRQLLSEDLSCKFLVFAHHKNVVDAVCLTLDEASVHYICIVGATPTASRAELVDRFQYTESCRCAVLSITAAGSGLTLTAAGLVLFAELHWNPGILIQAESRAHRIGQRGGVCARYLLAKGTSDDYMWPLLQDKLNVLNEVGLSGDTFEDTTLRIQENHNPESPSRKSNIANYFTKMTPDRNDLVPGTNIKKSSLGNPSTSINLPNCDNGHRGLEIEDTIDKSFLQDEEGDELLLQLDI